MKIICNHKDLLRGVQTVSRAVGGRSAWPILNNILLQTEGTKLRLTAFDLELGMECTVPAEIVEEGDCTIPAKVTAEMLSTFPNADITIETEGNGEKVKLTCDKSKYKLNGLPSIDFRSLPEIPADNSFTVTQGDLRELIRYTTMAVSLDDSRAILTGVLLELQDSELRFVSTDTHRLAVKTMSLDSQMQAKCILTKRVLDEVSRLLGDAETPVTISIASNQVKFEVNDVVIVSRLIEGMFPNYERVIPETHTKTITVPTDELRGKVKRLLLVARDNANRIVFETENDILKLTAQSGEVGKAYEEIEIVKEGEDMKMAFNAKYFIDLLSAVGSDGIEMQLTGDLNPALIKPVGEEGYLHVIMPMQLV